LDYLEEAYPQLPLLPADHMKRAQIKGFCQIINSAMHPYQNLRLLDKIQEDFGVKDM